MSLRLAHITVFYRTTVCRCLHTVPTTDLRMTHDCPTPKYVFAYDDLYFCRICCHAIVEHIYCAKPSAVSSAFPKTLRITAALRQTLNVPRQTKTTSAFTRISITDVYHWALPTMFDQVMSWPNNKTRVSNTLC